MEISIVRNNHVYNDINNIPVNFIAEALLENMNIVSREPKLHKGICDEHATYKLFWCDTHQDWICPHCSIVEHPIGDCDIIPIRKKLENSTNIA